MAQAEHFGRTIGRPAEIHGAETIIAPRLHVSRSDSSDDSMRAEARRGVALIEGSTPHLSAETRDLLRNRLRIAAILFFVGFSAFLVRSLFYWNQFSEAEHFPLFITHGGVAIVLGVFAARLCQHCSYSLKTLRIAELVIFGCPALFFLVKAIGETNALMNLPDGRARLDSIVLPWALLIFTYALFIPNTWQRAAVVLSVFGAIPVVLLAYFYAQPAFSALVNRVEYSGFISGQILITAIVVMTGVVGVQTIGALRREAFAAKQLGQYRLKRLLGSGGMGEVYLAEHQMMKRPCAVKLIRPEKAGDPRMLARFEREVRATAKLSHWNSIDIYDYGRTADGTFYYVMEYLPGHNVGEIVQDYGPIPTARTVFLMQQVCAALAEAHGIGLVHRDIKPANIFCAYRGGIFDVVKLLDFGLAKPTMEKGQDAQLTLAGTITGSPLFMSPEQASGDDSVDARSDIYSLGAVIYYLLTGQPPFMSDNPLKVMIAHASQEVVPPRQINVEIPGELEEIILRCLEKDPEHRYQEVSTLRNALCELTIDDPWSSDLAAKWWSCNGCPERKKLAAEVVEAAAV
jgi:serine/threonine-protein kinase